MPEFTNCLPAEWESQSGILLTWPHAATDWVEHLQEVEGVFTRICKHICQHQKLIIACHDTVVADHVDTLLRGCGIPAGRYRLFIAPSNDTWARDHGPVTVIRNNTPCLLDFTFNGWGGKYPSELDNGITSRLHLANAFGATPLESLDFVLEGGSIETDGKGTILTTSSCLLSQTRNRGLTKNQVEARLSSYLGARRVIWLCHGCLQGDDTDGHIDNLARFINVDTLAYTACHDRDNPNFESLRLMETTLRTLKNNHHEPYRLVPLPLPVIRDDNHDLLPASYANFLIINHAVLVPIYDVPTDREALDILGDCFDDRSIIGIDCRPLIQQNGGLHCATMQLPKGVLL